MGRDEGPGLFAHIVWGLGFLVIALAIVAPLVMVARADGRVDFCYVEHRPGGVALMGHRPWRPDNVLGLYPSAEHAAPTARAMECPIR